MIQYRKLQPTYRPLQDAIIVWWNSLLLRMAKQQCKRMASGEGRPHYIVDMHSVLIVLNSAEKDDINKKVPKGSQMDYPTFLRNKIYEVTKDGRVIQ